MPNDLVTPPELDPNKSAARPGSFSADHLGIGGALEEEGIFASLWTNLRDALFPVKLPPLELTSKPIAVPDRMKVKRDPVTAAISFVVHALIILLIGFLLAKKVLKLAAPAHTVTSVDLNTPIAAIAPKTMGGGGGNHDITPATQGKLPPPVKIPMVPVMKPIIEHPILAAPPALMAQPMNMPTSPIDLGNPNGPKVAGPSSLGNGNGGGIGNGSGNGLGPGTGGGFGGGAYQVGGGVSAPVPIYQPDAEFSDEARRAKYQGDVTVNIVVGADGLVKQAQVVRGDVMGLGEKALEAVRQYKFKPSQKDGKPVPVRVTIEVTFTIY